MRLISTVLVAGLTLALTACGNGERSGPNSGAEKPAVNGSDPWTTYASPAWDHDRPEVQKTDSGIEYIVLASGPACDGGPTVGDRAIVHYEGRLEDGTVFDSSLSRGRAIDFPANGVIKGWTETLSLMCPGDDWMIYLPSDLAYGERGAGGDIGPNTDLLFRVILLADIAEGDWSGDNFR